MDKTESALLTTDNLVRPLEGIENDDNCYEIKYSDCLGRYLVAKRNIAALEVVIREEPSVRESIINHLILIIIKISLRLGLCTCG